MSNETNKRDKKIADAALAMGAGLAAIIFAAQFLNIPKNPWIAALLLIVGIGATIWASRKWRKL